MAKPGGSRSIMNDRRSDKTIFDDFPTHPWATRAALAFLEGVILLERDFTPLSRFTAWEPCANRGYMARPMMERFADVRCSDVTEYGQGYEVRDFLAVDQADENSVDFVFANPPFNHADAFLARALAVARVGVAFFLRSSFRYGQARYQRFFAPDVANRPSHNLIFSERCPLLHARIDPDANTATDYDWWFWRTDDAGNRAPTETHWCEPGARIRHFEQGDYLPGCTEFDGFGDSEYARLRMEEDAKADEYARPKAATTDERQGELL